MNVNSSPAEISGTQKGLILTGLYLVCVMLLASMWLKAGDFFSFKIYAVVT